MKLLMRIIKGENGFIGKTILIGIFFIGLFGIVTFSPIFFTQQDINNLVEDTVEEVEFKGKVDSDTQIFIDRYLQETKLDKLDNLDYKFSGDIYSDGKIQLRDTFKFEASGEKKIKVINFFGNPIELNIPVKKTLTGKSQVYYKPSEL